MHSCIDPAAFARLQRVGGRELIGKMIDLFLQNTPLRLEALQTGVQAGDWEVVERTAHSMKSSAAHLGLTLLGTGAAQTEVLARDGRVAEIRPLIEEMSRAFLSARTELLQAVQSGFGA